MQPNNDQFWKDNLFGKTPSLESHREAKSIWKKFSNLFEYETYYLIQDCALQHSILLTLFKSFLEQKPAVNIFFTKKLFLVSFYNFIILSSYHFIHLYNFLQINCSQYSLIISKCFIIEPSKQIEKQLVPKEINNTFYNYMIIQAATVGLCTSFVCGNIDESNSIKEHFNYLEKPVLCHKTWPNFSLIKNWNKQFYEKPCGISTIDIGSL